MAVEAKSRAAGELKERAQTLRNELLDTSKQFTKDEVEAKRQEIEALEQRAAVIAEFTPEKEIERQGGADLLKKAAPEVQEETLEYEQVEAKVRKAFGGPNGYLLALARRNSTDFKPWNEAQKAAHRAAQDLHKRTIIGDTSDASGGEFLLPLQQVQSIFKVDNVQMGLLERAQRFPVSGRTLRIPYMDQYDAAFTRPMAGIAATTIIGEGAEKPIREPQFLQRLLTVFKWAAYSEIGDEVLADDMTGQLSPTVISAVGGQIMNDINASVTIDGSGSSQPLGALHTSNGALYTVNRETSQNVTTTDVFEMDARHLDGAGSFWLAHVSLKPEIYGLTLSGNTLVSWISDLRGAPQATLLGKPIVWTHLTSVKGVAGDLALINPSHYAVGMRQSLTVESSIHYKFRNDITAYRFFARAGGIPIPTGTFSYKSDGTNKTYEVSPFVRLGDDATS